MVHRNGLSRIRLWKIAGYLVLGGGLSLGICEYVFAQVIPDNTLDAENSVVTPNLDIWGITSDQIEGGAARGVNLFHSFAEFNVGEGRGVYFANPTGIENILSRVTGGNESLIFGRLGVLGEANLFLLNPNGVVFGEKASLDIQGSFVASTAEGIELGTDGYFSATEPQESRLLSVSPGALFFNAVTAAGGTITNRGNLETGGDFTLSAGNLDLQGQVLAGKDLTLYAQDTITIRDSQTLPFIAAAKGNLLVQGNQVIDIFALNHADSGLFSGGNMVLRSASPVGGDAHYWSRGSFRIEQLDGRLGDLSSPKDPIIRSFGDVSFNSYVGTSLHIFAGGSVNIGTVIITGPEIGTAGIDFIAEDIQLSNGEMISIDGSQYPTLDVRAGLEESAVGLPDVTGLNFPIDLFLDPTFSFLEPKPNIKEPATSADIRIDDIVIAAPDGRVLLTNQYQPNPSLSGDIQVDRIWTNDSVFTGNAGSAIIDSRGDINIVNLIDSSSASGNAGDITLVADGRVSSAGGLIFSATRGAGVGGDTRIQARSVLLTQRARIITATLSTGDAGNLIVETGQLVVRDGSQLNTSTWGEGDGGQLNIRANQIELVGTNLINGNPSGLFTNVARNATGNGGDASIQTQNLRIFDGAELSASTSGEGNAGDLRVVATDRIEVGGSSSQGNSSSIRAQVERGATGKGGSLTLEMGELLVSQGGQISVGTFGTGDGGQLNVNATEIDLIGTNPINGSPSGLFTSVARNATGNGGDMTIQTQGLRILDGANLSTSTSGEGNAGDLQVVATDRIEMRGFDPQGFSSSISADVSPEATGKGGNLTLETGQLLVSQGGQISVSTFGTGDAGQLNLHATEIDLIGTNPINGSPSGSFADVAPNATGTGGDVMIQTQKLRLVDGAELSTSTSGEGNAGDLQVVATDGIQMRGHSSQGFSSGISAQVNPGATGKGGNLTLETGQLLVSQGGHISVGTFGTGNGGQLNVHATQIELIGDNPINGSPSGFFANVNPNATGKGGDVTIQTRGLLLLDGAGLSASTFGEGNAGDLQVVATDRIEVRGSGSQGNSSSIRAQVEPTATGKGGNLTLETGQLLVSQEGQISVGTFGSGDGGQLNIHATEIDLIGDDSIDGSLSGLFADVAPNATGNAGDVTIQTQNLRIIDGANLSAATFGKGNAGELRVVATDRIEVIGSDPQGNVSGIRAQVVRGATGKGGNLTLETRQLWVSQGGQINVSTFGTGDGGQLNVHATQIGLIGRNRINGAPSGLFAAVAPNATGTGGDVMIQTQELRLVDGAELSTSTFGEGNAGELRVVATDRIEVIGSDPQGNSSSIYAQVNPGATGTGGDLTLEMGQLLVNQGGQIGVTTFGTGDAGQLNIKAIQIDLINNNPIYSNVPSGLFASVAPNATGNGGDITIQTQGLRILDGARLSAPTSGKGNAGDLRVVATDRIEVRGFTLEGFPSGIDAMVATSATGRGGNLNLNAPSILIADRGEISVETRGNGAAGDLTINTERLTVTNDASVSASTSSSNPEATGGDLIINATNTIQLTRQGSIFARSTGAAPAGNIAINTGLLTATDGTIATSAEQSAGGAITLNARDIRLFGDSDITTRVANGEGGGGNITLSARTIVAFDDSDILAFAADGRGGDITLDTRAFFGDNYRPAPRNTDPRTLDFNNRVDINATGRIDGVIRTPDVSFIENSLTELPDNPIDTDSLLANSCIVRRNQPTGGSFILAGTGGLPQRPGDAPLSHFSTVDVEALPEDETPETEDIPWQKGDPIVEPQEVYRLPNGQLVLSRECFK
jgi:filamentous hemagglutinin family protein